MGWDLSSNGSALGMRRPPLSMNGRQGLQSNTSAARFTGENDNLTQSNDASQTVGTQPSSPDLLGAYGAGFTKSSKRSLAGMMADPFLAKPGAEVSKNLPKTVQSLHQTVQQAPTLEKYLPFKPLSSAEAANLRKDIAKDPSKILEYWMKELPKRFQPAEKSIADEGLETLAKNRVLDNLRGVLGNLTSNKLGSAAAGATGLGLFGMGIVDNWRKDTQEAKQNETGKPWDGLVTTGKSIWSLGKELGNSCASWEASNVGMQLGGLVFGFTGGVPLLLGKIAVSTLFSLATRKGLNELEDAFFPHKKKKEDQKA